MIFTLELLENSDFLYLKNSMFYKSFDKDGDNMEEELVCSYICPKNTEDINLFLDTIHFWDVKFKPSEFYELLLKTKPLKKLKDLIKISKDKYYIFLFNICKTPIEILKSELIDRAVEEEQFDLVIFCQEHKSFHNYTTTYIRGEKFYIRGGYLSRIAMKKGNLEILKYLYDNDYPLPYDYKRYIDNPKISNYIEELPDPKHIENR